MHHCIEFLAEFIHFVKTTTIIYSEGVPNPIVVENADDALLDGFLEGTVIAPKLAQEFVFNFNFDGFRDDRLNAIIGSKNVEDVDFIYSRKLKTGISVGNNPLGIIGGTGN